MLFPRTSLPLLALVMMPVICDGATIFNFESDTAGTPTPFTDTIGSLSATFGGLASVCASNGLFHSLTGNVLIQQFCATRSETGPLTISFNSTIGSLSFDFATAGGSSTLSLAAYENGTLIGTSDFVSSIPTGLFNGEGVASFSGAFNSVTLTASALLAMDNVAVTPVTTTPEPASISSLCALVLLFGWWRKKFAGCD